MCQCFREVKTVNQNTTYTSFSREGNANYVVYEFTFEIKFNYPYQLYYLNTDVDDFFNSFYVNF